MGVNAKIWELRKRSATARFPKTGVNKFQNYEYYTEADIFGIVVPIMAELGLSANYVVNCLDVDFSEKGYRVRATGTMELKDLESNEAYHFGPILGDGADNTDKAAYKVNTGLVRTLWCKFLGLSNRDEPERDEAPAVTRRAAPAKKAEPAGIGEPVSLDEPLTEEPVRDRAVATAKVWEANTLFSAAAKVGQLKRAQELRKAGRELDEIALELKL